MDTEDQKVQASLLLDIYSQTKYIVFEIHASTLLFLVALRWLILDMTDWQSWIVIALGVITMISAVSTLRKSYKLSKLSDEIKGI